MNPMPPIACGIFLAAMMAAGVSHYWSVERFIVDYPTTPAFRLVPATPAPDVTRPQPANPTSPPAEKVAATTSRPGDAHSKEFFENLIQELRNLRNESRALTNQIAETNRDVMKMQFQIDTHSESFRPMPTSDERDDRSQIYDDDFPGVLPPRAEPVYPTAE